MEKNELRKKLTLLIHKLRKSDLPENIDFDEPQSVVHDEVFFVGKTRKRKRIVLLSPACCVASCTMCPLPNEALGKDKKITSANLISQVKKAFAGADGSDHEMVTVYSNSNFFSDLDIFPEARIFIYEKFAASPASILVVESLPQFITAEKIAEAKKHLRGKKLSVAIGLQSADDTVRELAINSSCSRNAFENAVRLLKADGFTAQVFLMIKPPFLSEQEAIEDTAGSIGYLATLGIYDPILCATRVAPNTLVELLYKEKKFRPPWLWTIIEILRISHERFPDSNPRIAVSELKLEHNPGSVSASNCDKCNLRVVKAIEEFNNSRDLGLFDRLSCACHEDYLGYLDRELPDWKKVPISGRISEFLNNYQRR